MEGSAQVHAEREASIDDEDVGPFMASLGLSTA
jgi:hypothetical protein